MKTFVFLFWVLTFSSLQAEETRPIQLLSLSSPAFEYGKFIPVRYTCEGEDVSPELRWDTVPVGTQSLVLIAEDPDAPVGNWVHWVVWNIPDTVSVLPEGIPSRSRFQGMNQGINDFRRFGYGGPCPPPGPPHRYYFRLYALDTTLELPEKSRKQDVIKAIEGHILGYGEVMGRYQRKRRR